MSNLSDDFDARIARARQLLLEMIGSSGFRFDEQLRKLPGKQGIYRIFAESEPDITLRAGRTKTAAGGLRQRVYNNHFMGDQQGNFRQQMVDSGRCANLEAAKQFLKDNCRVQLVVIDDAVERKWIEHFILSILRPIHCD